MPQDRPLTRLADVARRQHGVVTIAQAGDAGLTRSQVGTLVLRGGWERPAPGLLLDRSAPATWEQRCQVAVLRNQGAASHRAAARLHGLDGFARAPVEVSVPRGRQPRRPGAVLHRVAPLDPVDLVVVAGICTTSVARTLCDLGAVVDDDRVEQALDDALRRGASARWIATTLDRLDRPGPSGTHALRRVLERPDRRGPLPDSRFERLVQRAVRAHGLPEPQRQVPVIDHDGDLVAVVDLGWPAVRLGIEAHSARWHDGARRGRADRRRDNRLAGLGWELLYAGWDDAVSPDGFVRDVGAAFRRRSASATTGLVS